MFRDLRNVLLKAVMHMDPIAPKFAPPTSSPGSASQNVTSTPQPFQGNLEDMERQAIFEKLARCSGGPRRNSPSTWHLPPHPNP